MNQLASGRPVTVRVPATTANLGPGFDCLGLALDLWNEATFTLEGEGLQLEANGESVGDLPLDERNMVIQGMRAYWQSRGMAAPRGLLVRCHNGIPVGSGMGSSAAAVLLGLLGAAALAGESLAREEALALAGRLEGHADNAAAALLGGLVIVAGQTAQGGWIIRQAAQPELRVAVALPAFRLSTRAARAALPAQVPLKDATFNVGRAALVVEALRAGDLDLLAQVMEDRLHQPYRLPLIPGAQQAWDAAKQAGAAAVALSGAGPSLIAFTQADPGPVCAAMAAAFEAAGLKARVFELKTSGLGAQVG